MSTATRIRQRLAKVIDGVSDLVRSIPIGHFVNDPNSGVVFLVPEFHFTKPSAEQQARQMKLKKEYDALAELMRLLIGNAPKNLNWQFNEADKGFRSWLELRADWLVSPQPNENEKMVRGAGAAFEPILSIFDLSGGSDVFVVPDTNAMLAAPDPLPYRACAGQDSFTFVLLPTVLGELDRLKVEHKKPEVCEKARKVIDRIKGWRHQGSLSDGVTVHKTITVRTSHAEPDMKRSLSWLDADNRDDRIVASILALQAEAPGARVVLVTGDINLQNKSDAALIETAEIP